MKRYILTGAPGSGKTAILRQLEFDGYSVVEEAATDLIALEQAKGIDEPWKQPSFIDNILQLQSQRYRQASSSSSKVQFHDRSPACTAALAAYLEYPTSELLSQELMRIRTERVFEREVFFIRNLGFMTNTEARRISFEESLRFEQIHERIYRDLGFEIVAIEPGTVRKRADVIKNYIRTVIQSN